MPPTFLLRAQLVDPLRSALPQVPVRPYAFDLTKGSWAAIGELRITDAEGNVELDVTGSPPVTSAFLGLLALRHDETGVVLAEQWASLATGDPTVLDFGEVRVWDPLLVDLPTRSLAGVPAAIADVLDASQAVAELEAQLAAAQGQLATAQDQLATAQGQLATAQAQLDATQAQLAAAQAAHAATLAQLAGVQGSLAQLEATHAATLAQLAGVQGSLAQLEATHATTLAELAGVQGSLAQLEATHATTLAELAAANAQIAELSAGLGSPTSLESVVDSVGEQLHATQSRLVANGSPFQLGRVSLSLKVVPASSTSFGFATLEQLASVGGEALSTLDLDFAQTAPAPAEPPPDAAVPSLVGLTEPAARRRLAPLGLGARVVHQAIADDGDVALAGRVLKQIPAAGAPLQPGQTVTLVLGKALLGSPAGHASP